MKDNSDDSRLFDGDYIFFKEIENKRTQPGNRMSIEKTASKLGMSESSYKRYKQGDTAPLENELEQVYRMCKYVKKFLFQLSNEDFSGNTKLRLIDKITRMSPSEIIILEQYMDVLKNNQKDDLQTTTYSSKLMMDAFSLIGTLYHKLVMVNLTTDKYVPIRVRDDEWRKTPEFKKKLKISEWISWFGDSDLIHPDDRARFKECTNMFSLKTTARLTKVDSSIRYRRLIGSSFRPVIMDIIRCPDYTDDNQTILIAVREDV
ncbi:MAG: hypothetical protein ACI4E1_03365 [Lachnospira sp.]